MVMRSPMQAGGCSKQGASPGQESEEDAAKASTGPESMAGWCVGGRCLNLCGCCAWARRLGSVCRSRIICVSRCVLFVFCVFEGAGRLNGC